MQQRLPSLLDEPVAFAHRGARAHLPENTLSAFALALRLGATGLESDVWVTLDGVAVLDHDGLVRGRFGRTRPIGEVPRAELPAHVPALTELFEQCGTGYHLSLDVRDPAIGDTVVRTIEEAAPDIVERVWICAPDWTSLRGLRGRGVRLVDSTRLKLLQEGPERRAATLAREGIDAINLHHTDWNGGLVTLFHRFDRATLGWDVQQPHQLSNAWRMGLDGVFSDHVDRMLDAYREELGAPPSAREG